MNPSVSKTLINVHLCFLHLSCICQLATCRAIFSLLYRSYNISGWEHLRWLFFMSHSGHEFHFLITCSFHMFCFLVVVVLIFSPSPSSFAYTTLENVIHKCHLSSTSVTCHSFVSLQCQQRRIWLSTKCLKLFSLFSIQYIQLMDWCGWWFPNGGTFWCLWLG